MDRKCGAKIPARCYRTNRPLSLKQRKRLCERLLGLLIAGQRLHPEGQPRELFADDPQLVLRAGFVEPVDQPDQRANMLLGQLKETLGGLGRHRTSSGRTATVSHGSALPAY